MAGQADLFSSGVRRKPLAFFYLLTTQFFWGGEDPSFLSLKKGTKVLKKGAEVKDKRETRDQKQQKGGPKKRPTKKRARNEGP
jgi:hypothetical protein